MPVISYENTGAATTVPGQADTYDLGSLVAEWRRMYLGNQADALQFGIAQDIVLGRVAADILGLGAGDTLRIAADGGLEFGSDVRLTRGGPNRLDLAAGDTLALDTIAEQTPAAGVTIDGALIKDGAIADAAVPASHSGSPHHADLHTAASHSDQVATGAELDALRGGGEISLHSHAGVQFEAVQVSVSSSQGTGTWPTAFGSTPLAVCTQVKDFGNVFASSIRTVSTTAVVVRGADASAPINAFGTLAT